MVRDGILYAAGLAAVAAAIVWLTGNGWYCLPLVLAAAFFLWFFRDPERPIPTSPGAVVSPADGRVTAVEEVSVEGQPRTRISIFLSVFDVHVNRSPIAGVVRNVEYRRGKFVNAIRPGSAEMNEQSVITLDGEGQTVVFKQIAGLLARRIVFTPRVGDTLARGQRVGMIKFGSRVDVILAAGVAPQVRPGEHVRGGASVIGVLRGEAA
jgi:phosphatidylserine decarboxylase